MSLTRQKLENEINNLKNDFRLLWFLKKNHNLHEPLSRILLKIRAFNILLESYPIIKCPKCNHIIEEI